MFGAYQFVSASSEEESTCSQTLCFPGALSVKRKAVPLHRKKRNLRNSQLDLKPISYDITPTNEKNVNVNEGEKEKQTHESFANNSLENIQEISENEQQMHNLSRNDYFHDPIQDLFPSANSSSLCELSDIETSDSNSISGTIIQKYKTNEKLQVDTTPVINNRTNLHVLEDVGNQVGVLSSKKKPNGKGTPIHSNCNHHDVRNTTLKKLNIDKENNISSSAYKNVCRVSQSDALFTPSVTHVHPVGLHLSEVEKRHIDPRDTRAETHGKVNRKLELQTPDRISGDIRSASVMMPPPVPRMGPTQDQKLHFLVINGKHYTVQFLLGRGGSSKVYQVLDSGTSLPLAVKEVDLSFGESSVTEGYLREIDLLRKLQGSESVIRMIDCEYLEEKEKLYVVMEKGETDLSKLIKDITKTKPMPISTIVHYWTEMLRAVKYIHAKNVIHSDLKPANFLLVCGRLKLIDFGIASSVQNDMTSVYKDVQTGTFNYISPESLQITSSNDRDKVFRISYKSDIWSLGCILYNLLFGRTPFQHIVPQYAKYAAITNKNHNIEYPATRNDCPPVLMHAVKECLIYDPKKRPTAAELMELPYFNPNPVDLELGLPG